MLPTNAWIKVYSRSIIKVNWLFCPYIYIRIFMEQSGFCFPLSKPLSTVILREAVWQWKKYEPRCQEGVLQNWHVGHLKLKSIYLIFIWFFLTLNPIFCGAKQQQLYIKYPTAAANISDYHQPISDVVLFSLFVCLFVYLAVRWNILLYCLVP